jgi:acetyl esterase/lipase
MLLLATLVPLLIVVGVLGAAALDGGDDGSPRAAPRPLSRGYAPAGTERIDIGRGARGAAVFRRRASAWDGPVVLFLHGWAAGGPRAYGAWIGHLTRNGATVIYPTYQVAPFVDTVSPLPNLLAAIAEVVGDVPALRRPLVVVGHSAGGALAADYAASARAAGLPSAAAVLSVYPGRSLRGIPLRIPTVSARNIPAGTRVLALAGDDDRVVGTSVAREIVRTATRAHATLRILHDDAVDDHGAPQRSDAATRQAFWGRLDRLIAATG